MKTIGLCHKPNRRPNSLAVADREAQKSDGFLHRGFHADKPFAKCVTDITEIKTKKEKLYLSAIFDRFDTGLPGLSMDINMKADLCVKTVGNAVTAHQELRGAAIHSGRGRQYTSRTYRTTTGKYRIIQNMNSADGHCHDNARCESMRARLKSELLYGRYNTEKMTIEEVKTIIWRYFMGCWNNRRIASSTGGLPPVIK